MKQTVTHFRESWIERLYVGCISHMEDHVPHFKFESLSFILSCHPLSLYLTFSDANGHMGLLRRARVSTLRR